MRRFLMTSRVFHARVEELPQILAFVTSQIKNSSCPESFRMKLEIVIEEAIVNIIMHAYENRQGMVEISYECEPSDKITVTLKDQGIFFNPVLAYHPVENLTLEERKIGGLGIPFMMEIMDKVEYQRKGDTNELTLIKYFSSF